MDRQAAQLDQTMTGIGGAPTPYEARYGQAERRGMFGTPEAAGGAGGASAPVTPTTTAFDTNGDRTLNAGELSQRNAAYRNAKMILADWEQIKSDPAASGRFVNKQWPSIGGFPAGPLTEEKRLYLETLVREVESLVKKAGKTEAASLVPTGMRPAPQPNGGGLPA